ncbi:MAG: DUF58 domain-containing protein [Chloroflexia bacterium]|nr:DUF58 domain-containing protein [Chloroflexia bacterium]
MIRRLRSRPVVPAPRALSRAAPTTPSHQEPLFSDELLSRLRHVILRSRRRTATGLSGEHRSLRKGPSPEFADFKPYAVGDDFRRIDWRAYARHDSLYVRESETTTEFDVHLLVDVSRSMDWSGDEELPTKLRHGLRLAGAIGYLSLWHFDRVTITPVGSDAGYPFGPAQGRSNIIPMLRYLERTHARAEADLAQAIKHYVFQKRRSGFLVIISDFLSDDLSRLESTIHGAAALGWQTLLLQIADPAEDDPADVATDAMTTEIADAETGTRMLVSHAPASLVHYRAARAVWTQQLGEIGAGSRATHVAVSTGERIEDVVFRLLFNLGLVARR